MKTTPKDFFLWVGAMASLLASTIALLALWFEYIDRVVGTVYYYDYGYSSAIITALSVLIVIFPLYIWFTRLLHRDIRAIPEKKELWVRKWLVYVALAAASLTLAIDLIILVQSFLSGEELTMAFMLKVVSVLVVVGSVFFYYLYEIKGVWDKREKLSVRIGVVLSFIVLASVCAAFLIIGSPRTQRLMRYDQQKVSDLQSIQSQVLSFYQQKEKLPESLGELNDPLSYFIVPNDPQADDGYKYTYSKKAALVFSLCARFNTQSQARKTDSSQYLMPDAEYWQHNAGEVCFDRTIDPEKYPPYNQKPTSRI